MHAATKSAADQRYQGSIWPSELKSPVMTPSNSGRNGGHNAENNTMAIMDFNRMH
jgi:hypothetical protein